MYKQCRSEQSMKRQRELELALLQEMRKRHYDEISVSDFCDLVGIPRKSFYRYFSSKDGALYALIDHALMDFDFYTSEAELAAEMAPLAYMEQVFEYWLHCKPLLDALERSNLSGILIQRAMEYTKGMEVVPNFLRVSDKRMRDYGTAFVVCGLMTIIVQWHHDGFSSSVEEMATLAIQLFSQPMVEGKWDLE